MSETKKVNYKRETATRTLKELIERVKNINKHKREYLHVKDIYVFGSYLKKTPTVHDLDVFVTWECTDFCNNIVKQNFDGKLINLSYSLSYSHEQHISFPARLFYIYDYYNRRIKNKSHIVSLHLIEEKDKLGLSPNECVQIVKDGVLDTNILKEITKNK